MARQRLGPKKTKRLRETTGLPIVKVLVRGNTGHRRDLFLEDGTIATLWPDGTLELDTGRTWEPGEAPETP